jgi:ligand-binding SRPBCC domain-containing protein
MLSNLEVWRFWSTSGVVEELTRVWRFVLVDDLLAFSPSLTLRYQAGFRFQEESN